MKSPKRKICVVTGSRAEYGLLFWLLKEIDADPELELQLVVTGSHLSSEFGKTESYILKDGFKISYRVDALIANDSIVATTKSTGIGIIGFADCFANLAPDVLLVLGDRFEVFSAVVAAMIARVPIAHLHGGETTEGVIDEAIRHSISKMSHLHFVAAEAYGRRLGQMGEEFSSIFVVGAMGLEWLHRNPVLLSKLELEAIT
ncbi:MAG: UDP-N-acetylglucosamine 2-epimerase, partial [Proteobacteria bacterium]|nr:UDP-N-acetylglucosamine 2-epimerase [Pseudomonadota bacterium]